MNKRIVFAWLLVVLTALGAFAQSSSTATIRGKVTKEDGSPIANYVNPPLTTIGVDIAELGRRAFAVLADAMERPGNTMRRECIGTTLVVRKTCAVPNSKTQKTRGRKKGEGS